MVEFLIFFSPVAPAGTTGDQFQLIFQKICVKKSIYLVPTLSEIFFLKFVWYPPCQKFLDTRLIQMSLQRLLRELNQSVACIWQKIEVKFLNTNYFYII